MQEVIQQFSETIRKAAAERTHVRIRGSGAKDFYGLALIGDVLDTRPCCGILEYEPTELVLTARAGTPLRDVEAALAKNRQMLPFEPPHFGAAATLGGSVACGFSGPRRAASEKPGEIAFDGGAALRVRGGASRAKRNVTLYE